MIQLQVVCLFPCLHTMYLISGLFMLACTIFDLSDKVEEDDCFYPEFRNDVHIYNSWVSEEECWTTYIEKSVELKNVVYP